MAVSRVLPRASRRSRRLSGPRAIRHLPRCEMLRRGHLTAFCSPSPSGLIRWSISPLPYGPYSSVFINIVRCTWPPARLKVQRSEDPAATTSGRPSRDHARPPPRRRPRRRLHRARARSAQGRDQKPRHVRRLVHRRRDHRRRGRLVADVRRGVRAVQPAPLRARGRDVLEQPHLPPVPVGV